MTTYYNVETGEAVEDAYTDSDGNPVPRTRFASSERWETATERDARLANEAEAVKQALLSSPDFNGRPVGILPHE